MKMNVHVHYAGTRWALEDGTTREDAAVEVLDMLRRGGGLVDFGLADGGTLTVLVSPGVPIAITGD